MLAEERGGARRGRGLAAEAHGLAEAAEATGLRMFVGGDEALGRDLRFAAVVQHVLRTRTTAAGALALVDLNPWTRRNFARWMFEDYPRAVLGTPRRWRRGTFTGPGSYAGDPVDVRP